MICGEQNWLHPGCLLNMHLASQATPVLFGGAVYNALPDTVQQ